MGFGKSRELPTLGKSVLLVSGAVLLSAAYVSQYCNMDDIASVNQGRVHISRH
jgi:hypothetical protein